MDNELLIASERETALLQKMLALAATRGLPIEAAQITETIDGIDIVYRLEFGVPDHASGIGTLAGN